MAMSRRVILNRVRQLERQLDGDAARGTLTPEQVVDLRRIHAETRAVLRSRRQLRRGSPQRRDRDAAVLADYEAGVPLLAIGQKWGMSYERVRRVAMANGTPLRGRWRRPPLTDDEVAETVSAYESGASIVALARRMRVAKPKVRSALVSQGVQIRERGGGPAPHGTRSAYNRHFREGTAPCEPCRAAERSYRHRHGKDF